MQKNYIFIIVLALFTPTNFVHPTKWEDFKSKIKSKFSNKASQEELKEIHDSTFLDKKEHESDDESLTNKVIAIKNHLTKKLSEKKKELGKKAKNFKQETIISALGSAAKKYTNNNYPYAQTLAKVRTTNGLCKEEATTIKKRLEVVQKNLAHLFKGTKIPLKAVPRIAICGSGGGYRAMVSTNGSMAGAASWGLFDVVTYLAGVSGSTWAIAGFMQSNLTPQAYLSQLHGRLEKSLVHDVNRKHFKEVGLAKLLTGQSCGFIDAYGNLIAQKILTGLDGKNNPNDFLIYHCSPKVLKGKLPIPLYTAVLVKDGQYSGWMEYTPFEIGSRDALKSFVPAWAFGRTFKEGTSSNSIAPQPLSFGMGIWGSAMTASIKDALEDVSKGVSQKNKNRINSFLDSDKTTKIQQARFVAPAQVPNWNYNTGNNFSDQKELLMVDAGLSINIPTPPFLGPDREVDIIIILDNGERACKSDDEEEQTEGGNQLKYTAEYAQKYGYKFPPIDYRKTSDIVSVHADPQDKTCPIVIYIPLTKNPNYKNGWNPSPKLKDAFTKTQNFSYTKEQVKKLSGLTQYNISEKATQKAIINAIALKINQKNPGTIKSH